MTHTCFDVTQDGHVAHIRLNRPDDFNTMTRAFWSELPAAWHEIDAKASARVVVLS